jgi:hypothetical protein
MLIDLIKTHALTEAQSGDWSAVAAILNAPTVEVRNPKSWTMADLIGLVQPEGAALVGGTIKVAGATNPIFDGAWIALNVAGLQLHTDERQKMIDSLALAGNWPDQLRDTVKAVGLSYTSLSDATAEQCEAAWLLDLKAIALETVVTTASEAAREEYRKEESTPESIVAAAVAVLEG